MTRFSCYSGDGTEMHVDVFDFGIAGSISITTGTPGTEECQCFTADPDTADQIADAIRAAAAQVRGAPAPQKPAAAPPPAVAIASRATVGPVTVCGMASDYQCWRAAKRFAASFVAADGFDWHAANAYLAVPGFTIRSVAYGPSTLPRMIEEGHVVVEVARCVVDKDSPGATPEPADNVLLAPVYARLDGLEMRLSLIEAHRCPDCWMHENYCACATRSCGCPASEHPEAGNLLKGAAERDGAVCALGWPVAAKAVGRG